MLTVFRRICEDGMMFLQIIDQIIVPKTRKILLKILKESLTQCIPVNSVAMPGATPPSSRRSRSVSRPRQANRAVREHWGSGPKEPTQ